jgi:hypothetical protein
LFDDQSSFLDLAFANQKVYTISKFDGIYSYDGSSWALEANYNQGTFLSTDVDTVWLARINEDFIKIADGVWSTNSGPYFRRICSKDGFMWSCGGRESGTLVNYSNESLQLFNADTIEFLMDNKNYDFKFSPNNNLFYTSGDYGISIASGYNFTDTISQGNTTGMPIGRIIEFEFDQDNNIWAVFGDANLRPTAIGHYNQVTNTWDEMFDENNSPLQFSLFNSIEIDPTGNLWVINKYNLFLYGINSTPAWVGLENRESYNFEIFPNPATNKLKIESQVLIHRFSIIDNCGRTVISYEQDTFKANVDFSKLMVGIYMILIQSEFGWYSEKLIKSE